MNHPKVEAVDFGSNWLGVCCLELISDFYVYLSIVFSAYYHWWICLLVWLLSSFFHYYFIILIIKNFFILIIFKFFLLLFFSFFLLFLLSRVADRILVLWPGVMPEPLRWESWVQDIGPPETSRPHVVSISESSPRDLHLNSNTQLHPTANKLQCWMPHAKQLARQEHNPTH